MVRNPSADVPSETATIAVSPQLRSTATMSTATTL